ncbi:RecA-like DNA recombinase [Gordonia phage GodonK]|uniref:RecA-like DNA recombinase n=1 Tax=Gordonia phage GodonK TaxID=2562192 RepID=A0A4D6E2D1_9CAUD|nr:Sak4-like ssDNA annealing protein [Gordonia phage GodonK]QBZ72766.1 RecA-like DNA recombinase [Gordonia phage GodonK]
MDRSISILLHGGAKAGKSTFAATSPKPLLYLDIEGGTKFLDIKKKIWNPSEAPPADDGTWDTAVVPIRTYEDVKKAYAWLQAGSHPFVSVVIDSISELQQRLVDHISNREQMRTQDWGDVLRQFMGLMRDFRDLTMHPTRPLESVILVAMSKDVNGVLKPFAQGQSATMLPYLFDIMGAMHVDSWTDDSGVHEVHRMLIGKNSIYETGERVGGRLPGYIDNPTVEGILEAIYGPRV